MALDARLDEFSTTGGNPHRLDDYVDSAPVAAGLTALEELARQPASAPGI